MDCSEEEKERIFIERTKKNYPAIWAYYEELLKNERLSERALQEFNFKRRKEILVYAYEHSSFYKSLYDSAGLDPYAVQTEADWDKVPVVTKDMVRENFEKIKVPGEIEKFGRANNTGGSTGKPLKVFNDRRDAVPCVYWRYRGWWQRKISRGGVQTYSGNIGQNEAVIYRPLPDTKNAVTEPKTYEPMQMCQLNAREMSEENVDRFISQMKKIRPKYVRGYAGAVYEFACICERRGISFSGVSGVEVVSTPTTLSMRRTMEKVFGCKVYDTYASNESLLIAAECACSTKTHHLHVFSDIKHIDILDDGNRIVPKGTEGRVAITSFNNRVFPFVKYLLGDRTRYLEEKCACGLPFPVIAPIQGRENDYLVGNDGTKIDVAVFSTVFDDYPDFVVGFQFIQHKDLTVTLRIAPRKDVSKEKIQEIFGCIQSVYPSVKMTLEIVDAIPHDGGKIRFIMHE